MAPRGYLFVYGTLRRGARAASLLGNADLLGAARYRGRLYDLGAYPGVVPSPEPADVVHGELYAVPSALLSRLDAYEGPEFRREQVRVERGAGAVCESWIYLYTGALVGCPRIVSGDYLAATRRR